MLSIQKVLANAIDNVNLSQDNAQAVMQQVMDGKVTPAQVAALLVALRIKGETIDEITGFARAMSDAAVRVNATRRPLVDTCGTGGGTIGTFNISTAAAFVAAGAGVAIAKHGNRSFTTQCGSADVLEALGVTLELPPERIGACIDEIGIGFLFAPAFHPAMRHAIGPRKEMGIHTVFNILGPLVNPASATAQVMGVFDGALTETLANVLANLGTKRAFVVHGRDGLDELSTIGVTQVSESRDGKIKTTNYQPEDFGLTRSSKEELAGGTPEKNAAILRLILSGEANDAQTNIVALNAATAICAGGACEQIRDGLPIARESLHSGMALEKLEQLVAFTNS